MGAGGTGGELSCGGRILGPAAITVRGARCDKKDKL